VTGAVGLVVKPLVGVADGLSTATEAVSNAADASIVRGQSRREASQRGDAADRGASSSAPPLAERSEQGGVFAQRVRHPRALGLHGEVTAYSTSSAEAQQFITASLARGGSKQRALSSGRYVGHAACGGPREQGQRRCVATTTHVLLYSGGELTWAEPLANLGALEQTGDAVVMHLRDGGVRLVPCAGGASERNECFELIDRCLRAQ